MSAVRRGPGVSVAAARRWQPLPVSGCHLVSLGRRAVRQGHRLQAPGIARSHPKTAWLLGPPSLGSAWVPGPPSQGQLTLRPARLQNPKEDTGAAKLKVVPQLAQVSSKQPGPEGSAASQVAQGDGGCPGEEERRPPLPAVCRLPAVPAQPAPKPGIPGTAMGWSTGTSPRRDGCWGPGAGRLDRGLCCLMAWGWEVLGAGLCLPGQERVGGQWGWAEHQLWTSPMW